MNKSKTKISKEEKAAIDLGLKSVKAGNVKSHEEVIKETKAKFPQLI